MVATSPGGGDIQACYFLYLVLRDSAYLSAGGSVQYVTHRIGYIFRVDVVHMRAFVKRRPFPASCFQKFRFDNSWAQMLQQIERQISRIFLLV